MEEIKIKNLKLYSPQPPEAYSFIGDEGLRAGGGSDLMSDDRRAWWNLYWLSDPNVDRWLVLGGWDAGVPGLKDTFRASAKTVNQQQLGGVPIKDLLETLTPTEFVERLQASRHDHLYIAKEVGAGWLAQVAQRAQLYRGSLKSEGRVTHVNFGQKTPDNKVLQEAGTSAAIMPLSLREKPTCPR